jgi:hypothetical protein
MNPFFAWCNRAIYRARRTVALWPLALKLTYARAHLLVLRGRVALKEWRERHS